MATISKTRLVFMLGASVAMVAAACWLATGAFPLSAAPQVVADAPGVSVNLNGLKLIHRSPVTYPADALAKGIEGTVAVLVRLDANGGVVDATVLSGPDELRAAAQQSVLTWHFDKSSASTAQVVNIDFVKPATAQPVPHPQRIRKTGVNAASSINLAPPSAPLPPTSGKLTRIVVTGLSDSARTELLSRLPVREGDAWSLGMLGAVSAAAKDFDSHLVTTLDQPTHGEFELRITPESTPVPVFSTTTSPGTGGGIGAGAGGGAGGGIGGASPQPGVYRVGNGVTQPKVVFKVDPVFPEDAGADPVAATVLLSCVIGAGGTAQDIHVVKSAGAGFDANAIGAVSQWRFNPGTLNGAPVNVRAQIEVNFRRE